MPQVINPLSFRLFFLPWLVVWVLIAPLFHIHTLDAQENHSGPPITLTHTVFTPDLPGEYSANSSDDQTEIQKHQSALAIHFLHYSEEALSLFSKAPSRQYMPGLMSPSHLLPQRDVVLDGGQYVIPDFVLPPISLQQSTVSLRAP